VVAIIIGVLQPVFLWVASRPAPLKGRNAIQFLVSSVLVALAYATYSAVAADTASAVDLITGALLLACVNLLLLEFWALLSRGYTLGLLLTLQRSSPRGLTGDELAANYRSGDSVDWIMRHRLEGLIGAKLVRREGDRLMLTSSLGVPVTLLYRASIAVLGLRRSG
jgi:hypothetical protein